MKTPAQLKTSWPPKTTAQLKTSWPRKSTRSPRAIQPLIAAVIALVLFTTACGGTSRSQVLTDLADTSIVPMYEQLNLAANDLVGAIDDLCNDPTEASLDQARAALIAVRAPWSATEAAWIGPTMQRRSWAVIDWPIAEDEIDALIADESVVLDVERIGKAVGADQRGLGAIDYLLGAPDTTTAAAAIWAPRRCDYMRATTQVIQAETASLESDWRTSFNDGDPYSDQIGADGSDALDSLINDALFLLEDMGDRELGTALGAMNGDADLDAIVEGPSGTGTSDMRNHLVGLRTMFIGDDNGEGLRPLLGDEITSRLVGQFDVALAAADAVGSPLRSEVVDNPQAIAEMRDGIKAIQVTVATEVVSKLGVTIGFSDADGDTGA